MDALRHIKWKGWLEKNHNDRKQYTNVKKLQGFFIFRRSTSGLAAKILLGNFTKKKASCGPLHGRSS